MRSTMIAIVTLVALVAALFFRGGASGTETTQTSTAATKDTLVYVGTYTGAKSKGIYLFKLQTENLEVFQNILLVPLGLAAETPNPSFLELDPKRRLLFA